MLRLPSCGAILAGAPRAGTLAPRPVAPVLSPAMKGIDGTIGAGDAAAAGLHLQACAVPFRRDAGMICYLLVTSSSGDRWIFPKGIVDPGFTPAETALLEAHEEAGASGRLSAAPLARFERHKWGRAWDVWVYALACEEIADDWLESWRQRRWAAFAEARNLVGKPFGRVLDAVHAALVAGDVPGLTGDD